jgi:two-component system, NarL family, nitrate/nitrite response regulator NarL
MEKVSVFACEAQPVVVEGLQRIFEAAEDLYLCGWAPGWVAARGAIITHQPLIVLLDNAAGYRQSMQYLAELASIAPRSAPVLWVSDLGETELIRSLQAGARGVIRRLEPVATLVACLRAVAAGGVWIEPELSGAWDQHARRGHPALTTREREVVSLVLQGKKNREIGTELGITSGTVKVHLMHIFEKTAAKDRFELALQAPRILGVRQEQESNLLARRQSA